MLHPKCVIVMASAGRYGTLRTLLAALPDRPPVVLRDLGPASVDCFQ
jgi:hypothetical protein